MIIRRHLTASYTAIPNEVITNTNLTIEARWLLVYLLSKPHSWIVRIEDIRRVGGIGRDKGYSLLKELVDAGYVQKHETRTEDGQYGAVEYLVYDEPFPENPNPVNPHLSKDLELVITDTLDTSVSKDARDRLWQEIPRISGVTGIPDKRLRPIIGKWLKILGDNAEVLNKVLSEAVEHNPADFVSWVTATVNGYAKKGSQSQNWLDLWK